MQYSSRLLESLLEELRIGPPGAAVKTVTVTWEEHQGRFNGFGIER